MPRYDGILDHVSTEGWFPGRLCPDAAGALKLSGIPPSPSLTDRDRLGLSWATVFLTYLRRFENSACARGPGGQQAFTEAMSILAVMSLLEQLGAKKEVAGKVESIDALDYCKWHDEFCGWWNERLLPSYKRLRMLKAEPQQVATIQPALSFVIVDRGFVLQDLNAMRHDMARGLAMHAEGRIKPQHTISISTDDLREFSRFLANRRVGYLDKRGYVRLDPKRIKTELDALIGRIDLRPALDSAEIEQVGDRSVSDPCHLSEVESRLMADLAVLPEQVRELLEGIRGAQDAQAVLDAIHDAASIADPATKAARLYLGFSGKIARARLAAALGTTEDKIRTAERKLS